MAPSNAFPDGGGDLYHPQPEGPVEVDSPAIAPASGSSLGRGLVYGLVAATAATAIWYGVAIATEKEFAVVALLLGALVGYGTAMGADRRGPEVALLSLGLFVVSFIAGEYLIQDHFYREAAAEEAEVAKIPLDGSYTESEARALLGIEEDEWAELPQETRRAMRAELREETEELKEFRLAQEPMEDKLPLAAFFGALPSILGFLGFVFLVGGSWNAYKIPLD